MGDFLSSFGDVRFVAWLVVTLFAYGFCYWRYQKHVQVKVNEITAQVIAEHRDNPLTKATDIDAEIQRMLRDSVFFVVIKYSIIVAVFTVVTTYLFFFGFRLPVSSSPEHWGQMGDFFGGMLNPILAFASFIALLYTIKLQSEEMKETRKELMQSRIAQQSLVEQARIEQEAHGRREVYRVLLASLTESNDRIKIMLEKPFTKVDPNLMPGHEKRPKDIVTWCFMRKIHSNPNYHDLKSCFASHIDNRDDLHEFLLEDIRPLLSECRRLKIIASDFEETCLALGIIPNSPVDVNFLTNFNHLMIKDAALNLKRARWLSETFDSFTIESFTPKPESLLDKFGAEGY